MIKYAKVINQETGLCEVGIGTNAEFYKSIGMIEFDVEQSDIDGNWYLKELCPHKSDEQKLQEAKDAKYQEANSKANEFLQSGEALYEFEEGKHIEATDGNIAKMNAYLTGLQAGSFEEVVWVSKEDEALALNAEDVATILLGLGQVQADVWSVQFLTYKDAIDEATTVEEVNAIEISYHN